MFKLGDVFQQLVKLLSMEQNPILARSVPLTSCRFSSTSAQYCISRLLPATYPCRHASLMMTSQTLLGSFLKVSLLRKIRT